MDHDRTLTVMHDHGESAIDDGVWEYSWVFARDGAGGGKSILLLAARRTRSTRGLTAVSQANLLTKIHRALQHEGPWEHQVEEKRERRKKWKERKMAKKSRDFQLMRVGAGLTHGNDGTCDGFGKCSEIGRDLTDLGSFSCRLRILNLSTSN